MERPPVELIGDLAIGDRLGALISDPHEGRLARAFFMGRPVTAAERAAYVAWLDERGDPRGEVLALAGALAAEPPPADAAAMRTRLHLLLPAIDRAWWLLVCAQLYLLNCGLGRGRSASVRFAFVCPRAWEGLTPTEVASVRYCGGCGEDVHRADDVGTAEALARAGRCIAVPAAIAAIGGYPYGQHITGRPAHPVHAWANRLFGPLPDPRDC